MILEFVPMNISSI